MMKRLLFALIGLLAVGYLQAQTDWIEKNSNLTAGLGIGEISVGMLDTNALWAMAINADGSIYDAFTRSMDAGENWFPGTFNAGTGLSQLFAIDATTCWAVFNTGATQGLYKTEDAGNTWVKKGTAYGASSFANLLHFFNENDGVAQGDPVGGYFEIYTTTDGGETWTRVPQANIPAPTSGEYGITGNYDAVGDDIWFGTNKGRVFHSSDKGLNWTAALTNFGSAETVAPVFESATNGICYRSYLNIGLETAIGRTTDGGATWTTVNVNGPMYARYITHVPGTESTYVGSSSEAGANGISYSTDGGYNWAPITEGYDFQASVWLNNATGWAGSIAQAGRTVGGMYIYDGPPLEPFAVPVISVTPDMVDVSAEVGGMATQDLTVSNTGGADLIYTASVIYDMPGNAEKSVNIESQASAVRVLGYNDMSKDPEFHPPTNSPANRDNATLQYDDGTYAGAIGWNSPPISPMVAARFTTDLTLPYAGMMLTSVEIYVNDMGSDFSLKIWDMGTSTTPGTLLVDQPFTATSYSFNTITLDNPVYITGADLWVGYQFTQADADIYIPGTDGGPANPNGDFLSTGVSWGHLSDNPDLDQNWIIHAFLTGTPITQWLTLSSNGGTITPGNSDMITATCDATGLDVGTYTATIRFSSNDANDPVLDVPVTFEVSQSIPTQFMLDFESQNDWDLTFDPWTVNDVDGANTYGIQGVDFPHSQEPMAYIAFNPATTDPPMTDDPEIQPHGGVRFGACMDAASPTYENNDWLISPQITLGTMSSIDFWVKSYTDEYGLEKYNVLVSTTDNDPDSFTQISETPYTEAPMAWTEVNYDLSDYDGQTVYIAIQCVSTDAFIFMVDDIHIDFMVGTPELSKDIHFSMFPNPAYDQLSITSGSEMNQVDIFNQLGQQVFSQVVKDKRFEMSTSGLNSGIYFVRITTNEGVATQKLIVK